MRVLLFLSFLIYLATSKYHLVKTKGKAEGLTTDGQIWEGIDKLSPNLRSDPALVEMVVVANIGRWKTTFYLE